MKKPKTVAAPLGTCPSDCSLFRDGQQCIDCKKTIEGRPFYRSHSMPGLGVTGPYCQRCNLKRDSSW